MCQHYLGSSGQSSTALKQSTEKLKILDEVCQGGRTIAGPSWTVTETVKVDLVVYTSTR